MKTVIFIVIGSLVLLYMIDKTEIVKPELSENKVESETENTITFENEKEKRKNEIYKNIFKSIKEVNPLRTERVWTYIEITNENRNIQLSYQKIHIPVYFKKCIELMKKNVPELIVLTPINIKEYLPDFKFEMNYKSKIPLKLRTDILFASILEEYGGLCISPVTIVYNVDEALKKLKNYEIVTFGGNIRIGNCDNNLEFPNSYIIGSQKKSPFIQEYKRYLELLEKDTYLYNFKIYDDSDILSHLINILEPSQYHFGTEYDGTINSRLERISLSDYLGTYEIDFQKKENLSVITVPYDMLFNSKYKWFLNLSEEQFTNSSLEINRLISKNI